MSENLKYTPLYAAHTKLNARIVDFAGWAMPVMYAGILDEARAVRTGVGIFDISHMGRVQVSGNGATAFLQSITSNNVENLAPPQAQYSLLTNPEGGIIDDIIVYREAAESYLVVINASNTDKDLTWMRQHAPDAISIENTTLETAMIAVQGPDAPALVAKLANDPALLECARFSYSTGTIAGATATFCRTGYTGEDGFELIVPDEQALVVWDALTDAGAVPCGLGARDALRIEAGYPLYGHEIDDTTSPVEAGLMWAVDMNKPDFIGKAKIAAVKAAGASKRLMGLVSTERIQPRQGYTIYVDDTEVGAVTSGIFSPTRGHSLAMGYVAVAYAKTGTAVSIAIRDKRCSAIVVQKKTLLTS